MDGAVAFACVLAIAGCGSKVPEACLAYAALPECPARECLRGEPDCRRGDQVCHCGPDGSIGPAMSYCRPCACPPPPEQRGAHCSAAIAGQWCEYDFESACKCVGPELTWQCCGGQPAHCPNAPPVDGAVCGCFFLLDYACDYPCSSKSCHCVDNHWRCKAAPAPADAGCP